MMFRRQSVGQVSFCEVHLLDGTLFSPQLSRKATGQELLMLVFRHLKIQDASSLGLVYDGEKSQQEWLNPTKLVRKQVPGDGPYQVFLQVRVYPMSPQTIKDAQTRYQIFLQAKRDVLEGRLRCSQQNMVDFLALFAQAELGDHSEDTFPEEYLERSGLMDSQASHKDRVVKAHKDMKGMTFDECELQVLELAECQDSYGVTLYPVMNGEREAVHLGLGPSGAHVVEGRVHVAVYEWASVLKVAQKFNTLSLRIRPPHTMAIHRVKFHCPSSSIAKQLVLLCHEMQGAYQLTTPYTNTFRRMWSGRGSAILRTPFEKLRSSLRRRPSSTGELSFTKRLSRHLSFQETGSRSTKGGVALLKRSISETFSEQKITGIEYSSPPNPVSTPVAMLYQETGQSVVSASPVTAPKQSSEAEGGARVAILSPPPGGRSSKRSKAVSDGSLNNVLDSSGDPVSNRTDSQPHDTNHLPIRIEDSRTGTPLAFRSPRMAFSGETPNSAHSSNTSLPSARGVSLQSTVKVSVVLEPGPATRSRQSDVGLYHFHGSALSTPEPPEVRLREAAGVAGDNHLQRHSHLWDTDDRDQTPFLDTHMATMFMETSQQDDLSCDL